MLGFDLEALNLLGLWLAGLKCIINGLHIFTSHLKNLVTVSRKKEHSRFLLAQSARCHRLR